MAVGVWGRGEPPPLRAAAHGHEPVSGGVVNSYIITTPHVKREKIWAALFGRCTVYAVF